MKNTFENNDLISIPNDLKGEFLFEGIPCSTIEVHNLIGDKGVEMIHERLAQMLEWHKIMFGERHKENFGFRPMEKFVDVQNEIILAVGGTIRSKIENLELENSKKDMFETYPELVVSEKYKKNKYKKLLSQDHYLIEVYGQHI